ncbi:tRNA-splicing endonuclease subunit Sen34-like [Macrobrachium rosenbergii]|uniref:tRNA-splicing endonuclease subunit Sen34-like n=1 Tax=Macrobrachium rosenbergii TaxID=79674 RepID=UPI0034D3EC35
MDLDEDNKVKIELDEDTVKTDVDDDDKVEMGEDEKPRILNITISHGRAHLWNSEDVHYARTKHRIVGVMVGSLPRHPHQTAVLGLPLHLMPEEVTLLLEKGFGKPVYYAEFTNPPTQDLADEFQEERRKCYEDQIDVAFRQRRQEIETNAEKILKGKLKKLEKQNVPNPGLTKERVIEMECDKIQKLPEHHQLIQIFTEHPMVDRFKPVDVNWSYPISQWEKLRYSVYKDLWDRGYYITSGTKFGGDFLLYGGDPILFHATFIVKCIKKFKDVSNCDLMTLSRLANATKKTLVLASCEGSKPCYRSFQLVEDKLITEQFWQRDETLHS